jgi:aryl-alcohol dehydrogenase-like predicted oxidoreductase
LSDVAEGRSLPMAQVALAWMLSKPFITAPIIGATQLHHLEDAVAALSLRLTTEEIRQLEAGYQPHTVRGFA